MTGSAVVPALIGLLVAPLLVGGILDRLVDGARRLRRWTGPQDALTEQGVPEIYRRGLDDARAGRLTSAQHAFEEVARREPGHAEAHARLAELATQRGDRQAALAEALLALRAAEGMDTLLAAADAYAAADRIDDALALYRHVLARDHGHLVALRRLRDAAVARARWSDALPAQERLVRLVSSGERPAERATLAALHYELGAARLAQHDAAGALSTLRDALRVQADFVPAHVALGDAHLQAGDPGQALRAWERGLDVAPAALPLLSRVEQRHRAEGRPRRMIALYERAAARAPDNLGVAVALGRVYFELSMLDEAAEQFQKIEVRAPELPSIHGFLGNIFERRGLLREACDEYRHALRAAGSLEWPHRCAACAAPHPGWADRCPSCQRWNTLQS